MATNSIKQICVKTFPIVRVPRWTSFDANILNKLGEATLDKDKSGRNRAAWVLAGGRSSRMGVDKARAESRGRALALRVSDHVQAAVDGKVSLVGDPAIYGDLGLPVIADRLPGEGPLAGIEAALAASGFEFNLIVACDMPEIRESLLEALFAAEGDCILPRHADGRVEPLCAVYRRDCHRAIRAALDSGVRKVTDAILKLAAEGYAVQYVPVSDPAGFANLNTPEDWHRYHHG